MLLPCRVSTNWGQSSLLALSYELAYRGPKIDWARRAHESEAVVPTKLPQVRCIPVQAPVAGDEVHALDGMPPPKLRCTWMEPRIQPSDPPICCSRSWSVTITESCAQPHLTLAVSLLEDRDEKTVLTPSQAGVIPSSSMFCYRKLTRAHTEGCNTKSRVVPDGRNAVSALLSPIENHGVDSTQPIKPRAEHTGASGVLDRIVVPARPGVRSLGERLALLIE